MNKPDNYDNYIKQYRSGKIKRSDLPIDVLEFLRFNDYLAKHPELKNLPIDEILKIRENSKAVAIEKYHKTMASKSNDEKRKIYENSINAYKKYKEKLSPDELKADSLKRSNSSKKYWANMSDKERKERSNISRDTMNKFWANLSEDDKNKLIRQRVQTTFSTEEKRKHISDISRQKALTEWNNRSDEDRSSISMKISESKKKWWDSLSEDENEVYKNQARNIWNNLDDNKRKEISDKIKKSWNNKSKQEKQEKIKKYLNWWNNLSSDDKALFSKKTLSNCAKNSLNKKFEKAFNESHLINEFYYIPECPSMNNDIVHCWDYGIFNENGDLVTVVDLDGAYYHGDKCDYDGLHSKEEYDERRGLSVPNDVPICIIIEHQFKQGFERLIQTVMLDYDEYIEKMFKECRSMPFPYPHYSDIELMKSWDKLKHMDTNDKYHQSISLNTRVGDHLIQHFHNSIWHDHRNGEISPYEAWQNDDLLRKCIENRTIYQTHLNSNKILQGFNIAKKAPKVSVFSAGRAKMIINKYLSEFDEIFDPFSGYSGRMLGTISLGKRYIGQDISERHVAESNNMMKFLHKYQVEFDASIVHKDILKSNGSYQCLFTCSPYGNKEQWEDVPVDLRTCDDWIDECLKRFDCKRYVFVVDNTEKYKDNIVDEISNKSHFGENKEYIIIIDRV